MLFQSVVGNENSRSVGKREGVLKKKKMMSSSSSSSSPSASSKDLSSAVVRAFTGKPKAQSKLTTVLALMADANADAQKTLNGVAFQTCVWRLQRDSNATLWNLNKQLLAELQTLARCVDERDALIALRG
jgi:hypothetical protein